MSEVKGNSNSSNSTGLLHPVNTDKVNVGANAKGSEKPLESTTTALHPLPKNQPTITVPHSASQTTQHHNQQPATEKTEIRFNSAVGSKNSQKINPFAEQNAKRAEKEKEQAKKRKKIIIALSAIATIAIVIIVVLLIQFIASLFQETPDNPIPSNDDLVFETGKTEENILNLNNLATNAYRNKDESSDNNVDNSEPNLAAAEAVFQEAVELPQNKDHLSQVYLSKMMFYINNGYYELATEIIEKIKPDDLTTEQKAQFYSYASMSYYYVGNDSKYEEFKKLNQQVQSTLQGYGG